MHKHIGCHFCFCLEAKDRIFLLRFHPKQIQHIRTVFNADQGFSLFPGRNGNRNLVTNLVVIFIGFKRQHRSCTLHAISRPIPPFREIGSKTGTVSTFRVFNMNQVPAIIFPVRVFYLQWQTGQSVLRSHFSPHDWLIVGVVYIPGQVVLA